MRQGRPAGQPHYGDRANAQFRDEQHNDSHDAAMPRLPSAERVQGASHHAGKGMVDCPKHRRYRKTPAFAVFSTACTNRGASLTSASAPLGVAASC